MFDQGFIWVQLVRRLCMHRVGRKLLPVRDQRKKPFMSTDKVSLYIKLSNNIKEYIAVHALKPGDRVPSIQDLCALFNVSHTTVRAALNQLTLEDVVESRPRQGVFVKRGKTVTNSVQRDKVIALLVSGEESAFEAGMIRGVMEQSLKAGYQVMVASNGSDVQIEAQQLEELSQQVSGLIVIPTHSSGNYAAYAKVLERGVPWVFVDRGVAGLAAPLVATDNEYGGFLGAQHLLDLGLRNIYAVSAKPVLSIQERIQGFRRAIKEAGLPYTPEKVRSSPQFVSAVGYAFTQQILQERQENERIGLFILDETLAPPCYAALKEANIRIPEDVAVISYDDVNARLFDPPLSSIRQEPHRMGVEATKMLIDLVQTHKTNVPELRLKPQLIVRNSSDGALPPAWVDYPSAPALGYKTLDLKTEKREMVNMTVA
jgi:GntR family transcriptional regulator of arabinose operon